MPDEPTLYGSMKGLDALNKILIVLCDTSEQEERERKEKEDAFE